MFTWFEYNGMKANPKKWYLLVSKKNFYELLLTENLIRVK